MISQAHVLLHVPFEQPGIIKTWLDKKGIAVGFVELFNGDPLPSVDKTEILFVMGGPMSANDDLLFPWLTEEKRFIREVCTAGKPMLGICLGAQLIAAAFGADVHPNNYREIGWYPVSSLPNDESCFCFPETFTAFHWHGETFDLPAKAKLLACSALCRNQAFQIGRKTIGLQFHLEMTPEMIKVMIDKCGKDLLNEKGIMSATEIVCTSKSVFRETNKLMEELLNWITKN